MKGSEHNDEERGTNYFPEGFENALVITEYGSVKYALGLVGGFPWVCQKIDNGPWTSLRLAYPAEVARYDALFLRKNRITI